MADIDLYQGGGIQPYSPSQPLAPAPDWSNTNTDVDLLRESTDTYTGGGQMILGQPLPPGVSIKQVTEAYQQLGNIFSSDFIGKLGHNVSQTQKAVAWFMSALTNPPAQQQKRHSYNLYEHTNDPIFQAFANYAHDNKFSAKMVSDCCWWVSEASRRLQAQQNVVSQAHGRAPIQTDPTADLTDQQFAVLVKHNENVKAQTMGRLEQRWGQCFRQNLALAQAHLNKMTPVEIAHFDRYTGSWPWTHFLNSYEGLVGLFEMSIGVNSMPTNGPAIAQEILQIEALMREPATRRAYLNDDALQARYRQLLSLTLGGR